MFTSKNLLMLIGRNALISLVAISVSYGLIFFLKREIIQISDSVALKHKLEAKLKNRIELSSIIERDAQIVGKNDIILNNAFISSNNILEFINALDNLAISKSIPQSYRFETPIPSTISGPFPLSTISYSNNLTTNVLDFSNYLKDFEKLQYFTKIEGFNISSQSSLGWKETSTVSIRATLFTRSAQ